MLRKISELPLVQFSDLKGKSSRKFCLKKDKVNEEKPIYICTRVYV